MKTCPQCGAENLDAATSCRLCDVTLESQISSQDSPDTCPNCKAINEAGSLFCQRCGSRLQEDEQSQDSRQTQAENIDGRETAGSTSEGSAIDLPPDVPVESFKQPPASQEDAPTGEPKPPEESKSETASPPPFEQADLTIKTDPHPTTSIDYDRNTRIVCDSCGAVQFNGGMFCTSCGEEISALAIARKRSHKEKKAAPVLTIITEGGQDGQTFTLDREKTLIGRNQGEITFSHDGFMSGRHASVIEREGKHFLIDENSRNGTFIRISEEVTLQSGDRILLGKQIFEFKI